MDKVKNQPPSPPEVPPPPPAPAHSSSTPPCCSSSCCSKIFLVPIILAVLVIVLGLGYLAGTKILPPKTPISPQIIPQPTPTPLPSKASATEGDPTANWKRYKYENNKDLSVPFGYSIKYPADWEISTTKDTRADFGMLYLFSPGKSSAHISAKPLRENGPTLIDIINNDKSYLNNIEQEEITLPFGRAIQTIGVMNDRNRSDDIGKLWQVVYLENNDIVYRLFFLQPSNEDYLKTFDQILSTFRFLPASPTGGDQGQVVDTTNWKTYRSSSLGFSFKYPATYTNPETHDDYVTFTSPLNPDHKSNILEGDEVRISFTIAPSISKFGLGDSSEICLKEGFPSSTWRKIIKQSKIVIDGIEVDRYWWEDSAERGESICILKGQKRYGIAKFPYGVREEEFDQILSTFRFD